MVCSILIPSAKSPSPDPRISATSGLKVTVNTDNRTVSDTTMTKELEFIQNTYGIQDDEIYLLMKNAVDVAFAEDYVKDKLYRIMREVYGA